MTFFRYMDLTVYIVCIICHPLRCYYYSHNIDSETEAQRDCIMCPQPHSWWAAGSHFNSDAWLQSTWVSLPCYTLWSLPMGFKHTPIFFFLNVFIASNHVYDIQYIRNLEICNEDWIFLCIRSKIFWQFCRSETIRVTSCVYFTDSRVTIHRAAFRLLYVTRWLLLAGKASTGGVANAMMKSTPVKNSPEV